MELDDPGNFGSKRGRVLLGELYVVSASSRNGIKGHIAYQVASVRDPGHRGKSSTGFWIRKFVLHRPRSGDRWIWNPTTGIISRKPLQIVRGPSEYDMHRDLVANRAQVLDGRRCTVLFPVHHLEQNSQINTAR